MNRYMAAVAMIFFASQMVENRALGANYRSIDGSGNNLANPFWGQAGEDFLRLFSNDYEDGLSVPRGGFVSTLPSARSVSNEVAAQSSSVTNFLGASDWLWQWGQFIDHDLDLTEGSDPAEPFNVSVPQGDPFFDPFNTGTQEITLNRSAGHLDPSNIRQQENGITAYMDASMVYGSNTVRAAALRGTGGKLKTSLADNGEILPMRNTAGLPNDGGTSTDFFLAGDFRANEQIGLTASHTLFVREHNRIVDDLSARISAGDAQLIAKRDDALAGGLNSQDDFLYESARKLVGAQIQKITYEEYLPLLIGSDLPGFAGYDDTVNAGISNEFATAAFRLGHTQLSPTLKRLNNNGGPSAEGDIALQDSFFTPDEVQQHGVDSLLIGLASQESQAVDNLLIDDVRNFLFGPPGAGGFDLASLNIQRGRDHGLPSYSEVHDQLFGTSISSFSDLGSAGLGLFDDSIVALLENAYDSVDQIDLWIGGISELADDHGGLLGPTLTALLVDQFGRTRDGDRFFYLNGDQLEHLLVIDPTFGSTLLSDVILRNSGITSLQSNVFLTIPEPSALLLVAFGGAVAFTRRRSA